jgi:hypothetical protein
MASQRRAPTKRPPRPASKKTAPPPDQSEGTDAADNGTDGSVATAETGATGATGATASTDDVAKKPAPVTTSPTAKKAPPKTPKTATAGSARSTSGTPRSTTGTPRASTTGTAKSSTTKSGSSTTTKGTPSGSGSRPGSGGPNYRPPSGAARTRTPPPPRRKKKRATKQTVGAVVALVVIAAVVVFFSFAVNGSSSTTSTTIAPGAGGSGPEGVPIPSGTTLAAPGSSRYPQTIDQIECQTNEQVAYHIHVHLTIFVNGQARQIPYGIGITPPLQTTSQGGTFVDGGTCYYWLHTHADDGIIHVESPSQQTYDLGNFFDVWGQPLNSDQVGPAVGKLTVFLNGKPYAGDPRLIPLVAHNQIQIDEGSPTVPMQPQITFPTGL